MSQPKGQANTFKILPYQFIHVLDCNTNVTRVEIGPQTFIRQDHEQVTSGQLPQKMIVLPKQYYCIIENPIVKDKDGQPTQDRYGQFIVLHGEREIRFFEQYSTPFPLYPKENLLQQPTKLTVVKEGSALKIEAQRNFKSGENEILAGDQYLFKGPATYYPRIEEKILGQIDSILIKENQAILIRAKQEETDSNGVIRKSGEQWLIRTPGYYLPQVYEEFVKIIDAEILDNRKALHLKAIQTFKDVYSIERKAGEEYLITSEQTSAHIVDVFEELVTVINLTVLDPRQYCIIENPFDFETQRNKFGSKVLVEGPRSFFLRPNESLQYGIQDSYILSEDQALLLRAKEKCKFTEKKIVKNNQFEEVEVEYEPGNKWMIHGPCIYTPPIVVEVVEKRERIPLDKNEGVYVRDTRTGQVRTVFGESYMLKSHEELWSMELPNNVEQLLSSQYFHTGGKRDKWKVVSYRAPFNTSVQVYDYKTKKTRIVFGPALVSLEPDEVFTQLSLSGKTPKTPGIVNTLHVMMGPEFSTDEITVETSDHAVLKLLLAYNWRFKVDESNIESASKIFAVKDFIGDLCNQMASKVRAAVASVVFDKFHKTSAKLIRTAIFGVDEHGKIRKEYLMAKNNLVITNVDIKTVEPVDNQTRQSLQRSVSLAIEISTKKQEQAAQHVAEQQEQQAQGELDQLRIEDDLKAEAAKQKLLEMENKSQEVTQQGSAIAEAEAIAKAEQIKAQKEYELAQLRAKANKIEKEAALKQKQKEQDQNIKYEQEKAELEIRRAKELALIESNKFEQIIEALGQDTLISMANAGPEMQAELLKGLGLQGYIFTDGNNPINLFNGAQQLIGGSLSQ
ncbi:unnamed protein product [Paramecium pentaurelia]|uniref:Major vault protein n=1 Tax=Paramecium pentaurelia TaxID=43138 RepID=A0A8S1VGD2_9CILI|nr:unnamed protein product [Paramecium pentaurelia]